MHPDYFRIFLWYFIPAALVVSVMLGRVALLKGGLFFTRNIAESIGGMMARLTQGFEARIDEINWQQFVFFTRGDNIANLNEAMLYVRNNEQTKRIKVVTVIKNDRDLPANLERDIGFLDKVYPDIDIEFVTVHGNLWAATRQRAGGTVEDPGQLHVHWFAGRSLSLRFWRNWAACA